MKYLGQVNHKEIIYFELTVIGALCVALAAQCRTRPNTHTGLSAAEERNYPTALSIMSGLFVGLSAWSILEVSVNSSQERHSFYYDLQGFLLPAIGVLLGVNLDLCGRSCAKALLFRVNRANQVPLLNSDSAQVVRSTMSPDPAP